MRYFGGAVGHQTSLFATVLSAYNLGSIRTESEPITEHHNQANDKIPAQSEMAELQSQSISHAPPSNVPSTDPFSSGADRRPANQITDDSSESDERSSALGSEDDGYDSDVPFALV